MTLPTILLAAALTTVAQAPEPPRGIEFTGIAAEQRLPSQTFYIHYRGNPVLPGLNIYAPSIVKVDQTWWVFYGGFQPEDRQGEDYLYVATTDDPDLRGPYAHRKVIIEPGIYLHANDPAVVHRDGRWIMAMTTFLTEPRPFDWISIATSDDGLNWTPSRFDDRSHEIVIEGAEFDTIARPSLIYNDDQHRWEIYFDGRRITGPGPQDHERGQFLAVSTQQVPETFEFVGFVGPFWDADIKRLPDGRYIAAYRHDREVGQISFRFADSDDGINFTEHGIFISPDPANPYDDSAVTNPGWAIEPDGTIRAVLFGGSDAGVWSHQIGVAYPQLAVQGIAGEQVFNVRQAIDRDTQQLLVPKEVDMTEVVVWQYRDRPILRHRLEQPLEAGDRLPLPPVEPDQVLENGFAPPMASREDAQPFRPAPADPAPPPFQPSASSHLPNHPPTEVFEVTGFWSSRPPEDADVDQPRVDEWLAVDLGQPKQVTAITLLPRLHGYGFPLDFTLESSHDGRTWRAIPGHAYQNYPNPDNAPQRFQLDPPIEARHLRVRITRIRDHFAQLARVIVHHE